MSDEKVVCVADSLVRKFFALIDNPLKQSEQNVKITGSEQFGYFIEFNDPKFFIKFIDRESIISGIPCFRSFDRICCETDDSLRQIITYTVFNHENKVASYQRGKTSGEGRLIGERSIGVGGHTNELSKANFVHNSIRDHAYRENNEELDFPRPCDPIFKGLLYCPYGELVHRVHLGFVYEATTTEPAKPREDCLNDFKYQYKEELVSDINSYEKWSTLLIAAMTQPRTTFFGGSKG